VRAGRTRIVSIAGPADMAAGLDRLEGWRRALADAGLPEVGIERGDFTPASGADAMRRLLDSGLDFDGVFVASAQMASGALAVLHERGVRVPEDVGMVTIDNDYFAQSAVPPLTTIEQPTIEVGGRMASVLLRLIAGEEVERVTMMPVTVVERTSA
jgi:DNA-binding LacI/PurR family transcriptional regulator